MKLGTRVRVTLGKAEHWADGAAKALEGKLGTVNGIGKSEDASGRWVRPQILVSFDRPASKWWKWQTPAKSWWFDERELAPVDF